MLRFNDGVEIDTSGEYRPLKLKDGWYVVGHGLCMPVASRAEALAEIKVLTKATRATTQPEPSAWSDLCAAFASGENVNEKLAAVGRGERPKGADADRLLAKAIDDHCEALRVAKKAAAEWAAKDEGGRDRIAAAIIERLGECATDKDGDDTLEVVSELFEEHANLLARTNASALAHAIGQLGIVARALGHRRSMRLEQ